MASKIPINFACVAMASLAVAGSPAAALQEAPPKSCADRIPAVGEIALDCETLAEIDAAAAELVAAGLTPGIAVGIQHNGRLVLNKAYGQANLETDTPVTPDTVFNILSVTKIFTAAAIMQLAEQKKLRLDDPLSKYLPQFPSGHSVTIRHLLNHTSGIHDWAGGDLNFARIPKTSKELVEYIANQKPAFDFQPGAKWQYSNANYSLLGYVIEQVSRQTYPEYMSSNIFAKAGMNKTAVDRNADVVHGRARGYIPDPKASKGFVNGETVDWSVPWAGGAIRSTVPDLAKWFEDFYAGRIVSPATLNEMMAPARLQDGKLALSVPNDASATRGMGMDFYTFFGHRTVSSGGSFPGWDAHARTFLDSNIRYVILTNSPNTADLMDDRILKIFLTGKRRPQRKPVLPSS